MVRGDLQNKELAGYTWSPTASMRNLTHLLADAVKHKAMVYQLYFTGAFLQVKVKNRVFVKLESRCVEYFSSYSNCLGRAFILLNSMYGMNNSGKLSSDGLTEWFLEASFIQSQWQISIYYKYAPYGTKTIILSYVYDCVYWYNYEALVKWLVDTLGGRFHVNFLGYAH